MSKKKRNQDYKLDPEDKDGLTKRMWEIRDTLYFIEDRSKRVLSKENHNFLMDSVSVIQDYYTIPIDLRGLITGGILARDFINWVKNNKEEISKILKKGEIL